MVLGRVKPITIEEEVKGSYLDYAMSVIVSRALPDVRDGLKPVQRRILYAMHGLGVTHSSPYKKSARVVGDVLGKYHPHGDSSIYDTMVRMAQDFSLRYPLVDGQGNFGSVDGDNAAAERYTEARMTQVAADMLADLDKETVDFVPNYDESRQMPSVLPGLVPNMLMNGSTGIGVGMATNIPPHNLTELVDGMLAYMDEPEISVSELMTFIKGPDFPTGAIIYGTEGIRRAFDTGRGRILVRGRAEIEPEAKGGRDWIVISEIPYQVNKSTMIEKIAELVKDGKITGIRDIRDESDRSGMRVVVELKKDAQSQVILNQLFKMTQLQQSFSVNMLALVKGQPKQCSLKDMMDAFLEHREDVIVRRTRFDLRKAEERAHIVQGLLVAVENIDEVVKIIKASADPDEARAQLMERFTLSELQAQAILDMRLARLTGLEREKLEAEYKELQETIDRLRAILADRNMVLNLIREDLAGLKDRYSEPRRTEIAPGLEDFEAEDLIPDEQMAITITHEGYVKRTPLDSYRRQRRGGRGVAGMKSKEEDFVEQVEVASAVDTILVFTNKGRVHQLKVWEIPAGGRTARGKAFVNLLGLQSGEKAAAVVTVKGFDEPNRFVVMATASGQVKRTPLSDFARRRRGGVVAQGMKEGDYLIGAALVGPEEDILLAKSGGRSIRFSVDEIRPMGRSARGVRGVGLRGEEHVVAMVVLSGETSLLTVTEHGYGKRTDLEDYPVKGRGGLGVIDIKTTERNGNVVTTLPVHPEDEIILITRGGIMIRQSVEGISQIGRNTQGVKMVQLDDGDQVVSVALISANGNGEEEPA